MTGFRFSPVITTISLFLACLMLWASSWQWSKYKAKVLLLRSYAENAGEAPEQLLPATVLPSAAGERPQFDTAAVESRLQELVYKKVQVTGQFDLEHQLIVTNRRHATGPGHSLLAPFRVFAPDGAPSNVVVFVSRGFIPFDDRTPESWKKYDRPEPLTLTGVVKSAKKAGSSFLAPKNPGPATGDQFQRIWFFEEIGAMAAQLPYPTLTSIYLEKVPPADSVAPPRAMSAEERIAAAINPMSVEQRLAATPQNFPAEQVSFEIPPTTHFGYTIEWALLAVAALIVGWALQALPSLRRRLGLGQ